MAHYPGNPPRPGGGLRLAAGVSALAAAATLGLLGARSFTATGPHAGDAPRPAPALLQAEPARLAAVPAAVDLAAAPAPPKPKPKNPAKAAKPRRQAKSLVQAEAEEIIPHSPLLVDESEHDARPVVAAPSPRPRAHPLASSPPPSSPPAAPLTPAPVPGSIWTEIPIPRQQPEIRVWCEIPTGATLILEGPVRREWTRPDGRGPGMLVHEAILPGEYRYELRGLLYRQTGQPDVAGTFRANRFRLYAASVILDPNPSGRTRLEDWGDPP